DDKLKEMRDEIGKIKDEMKGSLEKNLEFIQKQSFQTGDIIKDVTSKLEKLESTNKQVVDFTGQLKNLEQVLTNSKNRGSLGEAGLEMILSNILPPGNYKMQYHFKNGEAVDAVIFIKNKILPVDAKFSLENYRRIINEKDNNKKIELEKAFKNDLKKRIDETAKYIRPQEDTLDFAFMFIPAEGIYYDLLVNEVGAVKVNTRSLIDYAFNEKKVIIVSPTTFAAYLQTVLQGLKALQIEESAKEIRQNVEKLNKHILNFEDYMKKLGNNLGTTVNMYNSAYKELNKIDKDVVKITDKEKTIEPMMIDKPALE
ncbi:DNA recombination protein RmuC, partial [Patescibacteria group bacterium]|nr:DNA recombination protein RmuC [Patescibacteria group bacterium]